MRWLDWYIDGIDRGTFSMSLGGLGGLGPFGRVGAIFNVVVAGGLTIVGLVLGFVGEYPGFGLAVIGAALEVVFVRIAVRAFRGDFDEFVLDPDEGDGDATDEPEE